MATKKPQIVSTAPSYCGCSNQVNGNVRRQGTPRDVGTHFPDLTMPSRRGSSDTETDGNRRPPVSIDLTPEQQRVLDLAVRSGAYQNPDEVIDQAFAIIREQLDLEDWMLGQREAIATHIAAGFAQAERGELIDGDEALAVLRRRRAERVKPQG